MRILKEYEGYQLVELYNNKLYVRFLAGMNNDMPCEFPITQEQANKAIEKPELIDEYISQFKRKVVCTKETFYKIGISEYIINALGKNQEQAKRHMKNYVDTKTFEMNFINAL